MHKCSDTVCESVRVLAAERVFLRLLDSTATSTPPRKPQNTYKKPVKYPKGKSLFPLAFLW